LIKGNHRINEIKLKKFLGGAKFKLADDKTIRHLTNSKTGFSGPIGLKNARLIADYEVRNMLNFVCGANKDDTHFVNVNVPRDLTINEYADLRFIEDGDVCPKCRKAKVSLSRAIELGHIFKLGTRYTEAAGAGYLDLDQKQKPIIMGCYGLGINRLVAACIEQNCDDKGICWPESLSPYRIVIVVLNPGEEKVLSFAEDIYAKVTGLGLDAVLDVRDERAGVKFKDADLLGIPLQVVLGRESLKKNKIELKLRGSHKKIIKGKSAILKEIKRRLNG